MSLTDNTVAEGAGPYLFQPDTDLSPGESYVVNLNNVAVDGKKRALRRYVPFDVATVTNASGTAAVTAEFNGKYPARVLPNTVESFDRQGVAKVRVTNESASATIAADELAVEVTREPYGADDEARDRKNTGPVSNVVEHFTGINPAGFL